MQRERAPLPLDCRWDDPIEREREDAAPPSRVFYRGPGGRMKSQDGFDGLVQGLDPQGRPDRVFVSA